MGGGVEFGGWRWCSSKLVDWKKLECLRYMNISFRCESQNKTKKLTSRQPGPTWTCPVLPSCRHSPSCRQFKCCFQILHRFAPRLFGMRDYMCGIQDHRLPKLSECPGTTITICRMRCNVMNGGLVVFRTYVSDGSIVPSRSRASLAGIRISCYFFAANLKRVVCMSSGGTGRGRLTTLYGKVQTHAPAAGVLSAC